MSAHPLDRPIWTALTTRQEPLAEIGGPARRYPVDIAPFADIADMSAGSWSALLQLMRTGEQAVLFTPDPIIPSRDFDVVMAATGEQMIGTPADFLGPAPAIVKLGTEDAPAMRDIVELTKPGPFGPRTHELGNFFGIKIDGRLVALTGERMKPANYTEMTAVCVHPDFRGKGYAQAMLAHVSRQILARGEIPFLHVYSQNASAISLYKRQGMTIRRRLHVTMLARAGEKAPESIPHLHT